MNNRPHNSLTRRAFLASTATAVAAATSGARNSSDIDCICVGLLGPGSHGSALLHAMETIGPRHYAKVVTVHRDSLDALIREGVNAVIVATPDHLHAETSIAALEAGLHVYCAAPMALTESDAANVRDAARAYDGVYQMGIASVFEPRWRAARALVQSGVIGGVRWCSGTTHEGPDGFEGGWKSDARCSNGSAAHHLHELWAACAFATGTHKPISVSSMGGGHKTEAALPDALCLSADFENGVHFSLDCRPAPETAPHAVIRGSAGSLIIAAECIVAMPEAPRDAPLHEVWRTDDRPSSTALEEWLDCIRTKEACTGNADLGYAVSLGISRTMAAYRANAVA